MGVGFCVHVLSPVFFLYRAELVGGLLGQAMIEAFNLVSRRESFIFVSVF